MRPWFVSSSAALLALFAAGACGRRHDSGPAGTTEVVLPVGKANPEARPTPSQVDPTALVELLALVPAEHGRVIGPKGTTLVGSDTHQKKNGRASIPESGEPSGPNKAADQPNGSVVGRVLVRPLLSSPLLERASREQLYWEFARSCRLPNGKLPPSDTILLHFDIRADGMVLPASVLVSAEDPALHEVAACVESVFAASGFRGPIEGRGATVSVHITWPSVD